jgi:hypothetical protein
VEILSSAELVLISPLLTNIFTLLCFVCEVSQSLGPKARVEEVIATTMSQWTVAYRFIERRLMLLSIPSPMELSKVTGCERLKEVFIRVVGKLPA